MTELNYSFSLVVHSDSSKGGAYILSENPSLEVARRHRLLLEPLQKLKARYSVLIDGHHFTVENGRAQFQFGYRFGDRREFLFQWQAIARPKVRFTGSVENYDRSVAIELNFEDPVRRIEGCFGTFRHHGRYKIREGLRHADRSQQTGIPVLGQRAYPSYFTNSPSAIQDANGLTKNSLFPFHTISAFTDNSLASVRSLRV
jgi:hypothetical protein